MALSEPIALTERIELEIVQVPQSDGTVVYEYGASAVARDGARSNILAALHGDEHHQNLNRVSTLCMTACAAFGPPPDHPRTLQEVAPEQFGLALIELFEQMLLRLSAAVYPYRRVTGITGDSARKTRLFANAISIADYARAGRLPTDYDEDDLFALWHDAASLLSVRPLDRRHIIAPLDWRGTLTSPTQAALLVDLVLIGALVRLHLSQHEYQHDTSPFFVSDAPVMLAELGVLAGFEPEELINSPDGELGVLRDFVAVDRLEDAAIPPVLAREWLRARGLPGF
ncbi:hypothetical protein LZC95_19445 [Pendulispora brunnea]|uniref:Uncharacterized protein n=1 Tax=Pendulispora brunnea TaxID=2905690 RepID=A0ABZ2KJY7_9BACT